MIFQWWSQHSCLLARGIVPGVLGAALCLAALSQSVGRCLGAPSFARVSGGRRSAGIFALCARGLQSGPIGRARVCAPDLACPRLGTRTCLHKGGSGACSAQRFAVHAAILLALRFAGPSWLVPCHWQGGGHRLTCTLSGVEVPSMASSGEKVSRALPPLGRTIQIFFFLVRF